MSNPSKQLGTAWETEIVRVAQAHGLKAWRLAEGGPNDAGDIAIETKDGDVYVCEAKCRTNLNIHETLDKATVKAENADLPFVPAGVAVAWKRLVNTGGRRRVQAGPPVVAVELGEWLDLISR